jgi:hypothetical protein
VKSLTVNQIRIMDRLANGNDIYQCWDTERCIWEKTNDKESKSVVNSLHDLGFVTTRYGFRFRYDASLKRDRAYLLVSITDAGRVALYKYEGIR